MTESSRSKTIEVMARALYEAVDYETPWKDVVARYPATYRDARAQAAATLTAYESHLQAEGMAVVPVEPTQAMIRAGISAITDDDGALGDAYTAMLAASPYGKAVVQEASAERSGANSNPVKERDDE